MGLQAAALLVDLILGRHGQLLSGGVRMARLRATRRSGQRVAAPPPDRTGSPTSIAVGAGLSMGRRRPEIRWPSEKRLRRYALTGRWGRCARAPVTTWRASSSTDRLPGGGRCAGCGGNAVPVISASSPMISADHRRGSVSAVLGSAGALGLPCRASAAAI
ncbi:MAG: hypothetical protein WCK70_01970 [Chloroflexales bacterium]